MDNRKNLKFKIHGIDHIAIATNDHKSAEYFFEEILGLNYLGSEDVQSQNTTTRMVSSCHDSHSTLMDTHIQTKLEFVKGLGEQNPIKSYLEKKGGSGVHHIAFRVDNIYNAIDDLIDKGVKMINSSPIEGASKCLIAFVHPKQTGGILVELVQKIKKT